MDIWNRRQRKRRRGIWVHESELDDLYSDDDDDLYLDFLDGVETGNDIIGMDVEIGRSYDSSPDTSPTDSIEVDLPSVSHEVPKLVDIASKVVAKHVTCAELESHNPPVDEALLQKIAFWAFPQDEDHVKVFAQLSLSGNYEWSCGERKFLDGKIKKIRQVGFMVSAFVETTENVKVSITFEKQHLTSTSCSSCTSAIFCSHIIAVVLERIKRSKDVPIHAPVTETLSTLSRDQLQKLLQYAINEDPGGVLGRVFQYIDEIRDTNSEYNLMAGAPDPTFGLLPDDKSALDLSLEQLKKNIDSELGDRYLKQSYKDTCDLFVKSSSNFYTRFIQRVTDLTKENEIEAAGKVLITIANSSLYVSNFRWSTSSKRVFVDIERMFSCFIVCFTGQIRKEMIETAQKINREIKGYQPRPAFLQPDDWSDMTAIKLQNIGGTSVSEIFDVDASLPFYEPLVASQLPETPDSLLSVFNKEKKMADVSYDEPIDVMMFRFECLVQYLEWKDDYTCRYKMCILGSFILRKLLTLSENFSILTFERKRSEAVGPAVDKDEAIADDDSLDPTPPKKIRRTEPPKSKKTRGKKRASKEDEIINKIKDEMNNSCSSTTFEGLTKGQLCYSMLYISYRIWQASLVNGLLERSEPLVLDILLDATLRVFEISRFRYHTPMELKEVKWWETLMDKILNYIKLLNDFEPFEEKAYLYGKALLHSKLDFYGEFLPLPLIDLLIKSGHLPDDDKLSIAVDVLCYSKKPVYKFQFRNDSTDYSSESEKINLRCSVVAKYRTLLSLVFSNKDPEQFYAARQVLWCLENVQDGEYVVAAYNCIKSNVENITEKEDQLVLLTVLLNCIKECVSSSGANGLYSHSTGVGETLLVLSKTLSEEFPKHLLPVWSEICRYFPKNLLKQLLGVIKESVEKNPAIITDMAQTLQKYFTATFSHDKECCGLIKVFFVDETRRTPILKKIASNASHYTTGALLRIGILDYKMRSQTNPSITVFNKQTYQFLLLGLKPIKEKEIPMYLGSSSGLHLNSKEIKYLKWYFEKLAQCVNKDVIKSEQFTKLMALLKGVLKRDVTLMLDFYHAMEVSVLGLKETKSILGSELVSSYKLKFMRDIRNCNHTQYIYILEDMKVARTACEQYVPYGSKEFSCIVVTHLRQMFKSKRKLIQLMDDVFPECIPSKKADKKVKK